MRTTALGGGFEEFLASSEIIDCDHPAVKRLAAEVRRQTELQTIHAAYETVRDRYPHSYDIGAEEVSVSASDVIRHGHGICFAKSHLLAAVLRACGIPAALCYQRLRYSDDDPGRTCLHGLNAVWLDDSQRWHRVDPRGNKPGIDASFDPHANAWPTTCEPSWANAIIWKGMPSPSAASLTRCEPARRFANSIRSFRPT